MEKIELKHLTGYLPYSLKGIEAIGKPVHILHTLDLNQKAVWRNREFPAVVGRIDCKPILRPLSDLTKEIEVNGEKFVPTYELYKLIDEFGIGSPTIVISKTFSGISIHWYSGKQQSSTNPVPLSFYEKLYEWHFDVHGLLQKGLAIDKNTLP